MGGGRPGRPPQGGPLSEERLETGRIGDVAWASLTRPHPGFKVSGDRALVAGTPERILLAVVDGLGHGPAAAEASDAVWREAERSSPEELPVFFERCDAALRTTRGAVMSVVLAEPARGMLRWTGVGNVSGAIARRGPRAEVRRLASHGGIVGAGGMARRVEEVPFQRGDVLVLASDGIRSGFLEDVDVLAPLGELAAQLVRAHGRETDDACVLLARAQA